MGGEGRRRRERDRRGEGRDGVYERTVKGREKSEKWEKKLRRAKRKRRRNMMGRGGGEIWEES